MIRRRTALFPRGRIRETLTQVHAYLSAQGVSAYLVGGYLRDHLVGRASRDIDVAVGGDGLELARALAGQVGGKLVGLDEPGGVARLVFGRGSASWHLDIAGFSGTIQQDLARRDFTLNALALELGDALSNHVSLLDPFGGQKDLEARAIRSVSEAAFTSDPVRLLRGMRLARQLSFSLVPETSEQMRRHSSLISRVAGERVREELNGLMAQPGAGQAFLCLHSLGLLEPLLPELTTCEGIEQPKEHHWDVFHHSIEAVSAAEGLLRQASGPPAALLAPWDDRLQGHFQVHVAAGVPRWLLLKWAALFHDLGKPSAKTIEAGGRIRFLGHARVGSGQVRAIMSRLRFSNKEADYVAILVEHHMRPAELIHLQPPSRRAIYRYFRDTGEGGLDVLFLFLADYMATCGPSLDLERWRQDVGRMASLIAGHFEEKEAVPVPKLLDGHDIMKRFQLSPGPLLGRLLEAVREAQGAGEVSNREEALALAGRLLKEGD